MGACFVTTAFDGKLTAQQLTQAYDSHVENLRHEHGSNPYNGTFSTLNGISVENQVFNTQTEAENYLESRCAKWENAVAVRFKHSTQETTKEPTFRGKTSEQTADAIFVTVNSVSQTYVLRCIVNTYEDGKRQTVSADQLTDAQRKKLDGLYSAWHAKNLQLQEVGLHFRTALQEVGQTKQPITNELLKRLKVYGNQRHKLMAAADEAAQKLREADEKFAAKLYETKTVEHGEQWLVGGVCAE
jgi:hypothetical protein